MFIYNIENKIKNMKKLKYVQLFEDFLIEHHLGLEKLPSIEIEPNRFQYTEEGKEAWKKYQEGQVDYLKSKGLSQDVINYWTRPDTDEEHQENIQLPWFYNEVITGKFTFNFEEGFFNVKEFYPYISRKTREERERKWSDSIENGTEFFKGQKVLGNTPKEREEYMRTSTINYFNKMSKEKNKSKPICVEEPFNDKGNWIIIDGGHRLWSLERFFPDGLELHAVKVTEQKNNRI